MKQVVLGLLLLLATLGGCASPTGSDAALGALTWPAMAVETTAVEPFELRGPIHVAWGDGFAIEAGREPDLAPRSLVVGDRFFSSYTTRWIEDGPERGLALGNRLQLWNLRELVARDGVRVTEQSPGAFTVSSDGSDMPFSLQLNVVDGRVEKAVLASPIGRESPITFTPGPGPSFAPAVPAPVQRRAVVEAKDPDVVTGHSLIVQLIRDYQASRAGQLPEAVTPENLRLELLARRATWPTNPYDGQPVTAGQEAGQFTWTRCTTQDGVFYGARWDGLSLRQSFGRGCNVRFSTTT